MAGEVHQGEKRQARFAQLGRQQHLAVLALGVGGRGQAGQLEEL